MAGANFPFAGSTEGVLQRIQPLGELTTGAALLPELEDLGFYDYRREHAARLLGTMQAGVLLERFGAEVMAWTVANGRRWESEEFQTQLEEEGFNPRFLVWSKLLAWPDHGYERTAPKAAAVLRQNAVMEAMHGKQLAQIDLPRLLRESALPGVELEDKRIGAYAFIPLNIQSDILHATQGYIESWPGQEDIESQPVISSKRKLMVSYSTWLDTPVGFALTYKGIPQAVVGMQVNGQNELIVQQLQQVQGTLYDTERKNKIVGRRLPRGLMTIDGSAVLLRSAAILAEGLGMESVALQTSEEVRSRTCNGKQTCFLTREQAVLAYDAVAYRMGFKRDDDDRWHVSSRLLAAGESVPSAADRVLRPAGRVGAIALDLWVHATFTTESVDHRIDAIEEVFAPLGPEAGPLKEAIAAANARGKVRVLDAGCGRIMALTELKEMVLQSTSLRKSDVIAVGINGHSFVDDLNNEEFDRVIENDVGFRRDHLAHAVVEPAYYDVAYAHDVLAYNNDPAAIIDNLLSAIRPGGVFFGDISPNQVKDIQPLISRLRAGDWSICSYRGVLDGSERVFYKITKPVAA